MKTLTKTQVEALSSQIFEEILPSLQKKRAKEVEKVKSLSEYAKAQKEVDKLAKLEKEITEIKTNVSKIVKQINTKQSEVFVSTSEYYGKYRLEIENTPSDYSLRSELIHDISRKIILESIDAKDLAALIKKIKESYA